MLDCICMGSADLPGARRKRQNTKLKIIGHDGTSAQKLDICSLMLYRLSYTRFDESCPIEITFIRCTMYTLVQVKEL